MTTECLALNSHLHPQSASHASPNPPQAHIEREVGERGRGGEGERERGREHSGSTSEEGAETMQEPKDGKENSGKRFWTCGGHCTGKLTAAMGVCVRTSHQSE